MPNYLFILDYYFKRWSTLDVFFAELLKRLADDGAQVTLALPVAPVPELRERLEHKNIRVLELSSWRARPEDAKSRRHPLRAVRELARNYDLSTCDAVSFFFCAPEWPMLIRIRSRAPRLIFHQRNEVRISTNPCRRTLAAHFSRLRLASYFADKIVVVYRGAAEALKHKHVHPSKIHVIYNGVCLDNFNLPSDRHGLCNELGIPDKQFLVLFVGSMIKAKGISELLEAMKSVRTEHPDTTVLLAGEGSDRERFEQQAEAEGLGGTIRFLGRRNDVPRLMRSVDMLVLPSHTEGICNVAYEAGAAELPVVMTSVGGIPEIVTDDKTGILVKPRNPDALSTAMLKLLGDRRLSARLAAGLHDEIQQSFTLQRMLAEHATLLKKISHFTLQPSALSKQPHYLFLLDYYFHQWSTLDVYFAELALDYARQGIRVTLAVPAMPVPEIREHFHHPNIEFAVLDQWRENPIETTSRRYPARAVRQLRKQVDLSNLSMAALYFCSYSLAIWFAMLARLRNRRMRIFFNQRGAVREHWNVVRRRLAAHLCQLRIISWLCDGILTVCEAAKQGLVQKHVHPSKLSVIYNGLPPKAFADDIQPKNLTRAFDIPPDHKVVLFVGSLIPRKGVTELIGAAHHVLRERSDVHFLLVGNGPLRDELAQKADDLNVAGHVVLTGGRTDIPELMRAADMLVLPAYAEGLPNVVLEAGAAGLPVVATNVDGTPEVVHDEESGLLVPPGDAEALAAAIVRMLEDEPLRRTCAETLKKIVEENFTLERMLREYREYYATAGTGGRKKNAKRAKSLAEV